MRSASVLGKELDALIGFEVVLHPKAVALGVDPHIGVAGVTIHVPPIFGNAAIAHQPCDLVGRLGREGPEIPLHIVIAEATIGTAFLRTDEVLELHRIANEENRRVVSHHVVVAFAGVELQREAAGSRQVSGLPLSPATVENRIKVFVLAPGWNRRSLGIGGDVFGYLEVAEGAGTLGVRLPFGNPFAVEVGHLLDQIRVLQQNWSVGPTVSEYSSLDTGMPASVVVGFRLSFFMFIPPLHFWFDLSDAANEKSEHFLKPRRSTFLARLAGWGLKDHRQRRRYRRAGAGDQITAQRKQTGREQNCCG